MLLGRLARGTAWLWLWFLAAPLIAAPLGPPVPAANWWTPGATVPAARAPRDAVRILAAPRLLELSPAEQAACLVIAARLGFNRVALPERLQHDDPAADLRRMERVVEAAEAVRAAGLEPVLALAPWVPWTPDSSYSERYLREHPTAAAVVAPTSAAARQRRGMISPTWLLDGECTYFDQRLDALADLCRRAKLTEVVFDETGNSPLDCSFDPLTLGAFQRVAGPPPKPAKRRALGPQPNFPGAPLLADPATRLAWVRFRCEQNSAILGLVRRRLGGRVPNLRVLLRGGTQAERALAQCGVDWRLAAPLSEVALVAAEPAQPAEPPDLADTFQAVRRATSRGRLAIEEPLPVAARLVLTAAAGATGLVAGPPEHWREPQLAALATTSTWLAEHEATMLHGERRIFDTDGDGRIDTVAVTDRVETLVVVVNDTARPGAFRPDTTGLSGIPPLVTLNPGEWRTFRTTGGRAP